MSDVDSMEKWFTRYGTAAVLFGRVVPGVRTFVSIPAGIARLPFGRFLFYSAVGTVAWNTLLAGAGYALRDDYETISSFISPIANIILVVLLLLYVFRVARKSS